MQVGGDNSHLVNIAPTARLAWIRCQHRHDERRVVATRAVVAGPSRQRFTRAPFVRGRKSVWPDGRHSPVGKATRGSDVIGILNAVGADRE